MVPSILALYCNVMRVRYEEPCTILRVVRYIVGNGEWTERGPSGKYAQNRR